VSEEATKFIRTELSSLKAVAIDTLSIESATQAPKNNFKVHKTLLDAGLYPTRPILIYEDVNIAIIVGKTIRRIYAFPLRLKGLEASPVTIVAEAAP
jgi:arylformamidase